MWTGSRLSGGGKPSLCGTYLVGSSMKKRRVQLLCWLQLMARGLARMIDLTLCECCELVTWMLTMQRHRFVAVSVWAHGRDSLRRPGGLSKKQANLDRGDKTGREPVEAVTRVVSLKSLFDFPIRGCYCATCQVDSCQTGATAPGRGAPPKV